MLDRLPQNTIIYNTPIHNDGWKNVVNSINGKYEI